MRFKDGMEAQGYASPHHQNQLFDLSSDPLEEINVAELHPWRVKEMQAELEELAATILEVGQADRQSHLPSYNLSHLASPILPPGGRVTEHRRPCRPP